MKEQKYILILILMTLLLAGCASTQETPNDSPSLFQRGERGVQETPTDSPSLFQRGNRGVQENTNPSDFEDISLSSQKKLRVLTNKMDVEQQTDNYLNNGQADVITRPDGTFLYPYGLAQASLTARKMMYSKIILQDGEKIMSAAAGDTTRWHILPNYIGDAASFTPVVLVKPFMGGLQTSLSIITDRRDYDVSIRSVDSGEYMPRIGFYYPQDKADAIHVGLPPDKIENNESRQPKINIENIKYDYRVKGDQKLSWYPTIVFEDGHKVFIRMPVHAERTSLPVFMTINKAGQTELVNYRYFKPYYVIDAIFDQGVLMLGTDKFRQIVRITRV